MHQSAVETDVARQFVSTTSIAARIWKKRSFGQITRIGLAVSLLVAGIAIYGPPLLYTTSSEAVLNARVITIAAPIEGHITTAPPPEGTAVNVGAPLLAIENPTVDRGRLDDLEAARTRTAEDLAGARHLVETLATQTDSLGQQMSDYLAATVTRLALEQKEAQADAQAAEASAVEARHNYQRKRALPPSTVVSLADLDQANQAAIRTQAVAERSRFTAQRLNAELEAAQHGILVGTDRNDVPYSEQRLDEFRLRKAEAEAQAATLTARLAQLEQQLSVERVRTANLSAIQLKAPQSGVVWRPLVANGSTVARDSDLMTLIDCSELYVTATFSSGQFDNLRPGRSAVVRLSGTGIDYPATVVDARAMQGSAGTERFAAPLPKLADRQVLAVLRLDNPEPLASTKYCDVGRRVEVWLPRNTVAQSGSEFARQ